MTRRAAARAACAPLGARSARPSRSLARAGRGRLPAVGAGPRGRAPRRLVLVRLRRPRPQGPARPRGALQREPVARPRQGRAPGRLLRGARQAAHGHRRGGGARALARRARGPAVPRARRRPRAARRLRGRARARLRPRARQRGVLRRTRDRRSRSVGDPVQPLDADRVRQRPRARARSASSIAAHLGRARRRRVAADPHGRRRRRRAGASRSPSRGGTGSRWSARRAGASSSRTGASRWAATRARRPCASGSASSEATA